MSVRHSQSEHASWPGRPHSDVMYLIAPQLVKVPYSSAFHSRTLQCAPHSQGTALPLIQFCFGSNQDAPTSCTALAHPQASELRSEVSCSDPHASREGRGNPSLGVGGSREGGKGGGSEARKRAQTERADSEPGAERESPVEGDSGIKAVLRFASVDCAWGLRGSGRRRVSLVGGSNGKPPATVTQCHALQRRRNPG